MFAKTNDSGRTWRASIITDKHNFHAESVMFVDTLVGYVSGVGYLYKTEDGGTT